MIRNGNTKGKIYTSLSLSLLLTLSIPAAIKASSDDSSYFDKSMIYMQLLNSAMPLIKSTTYDEDDMAEYSYSFKDDILNLAGLDVESPLSIVSREFNLIKDGEPEGTSRETKTSFTLNPFKLNENNIIKIADNNKTTNDNVDYTKAAQAYNPKLKKTLNSSMPEVLIYHSHTTEAYKPYAENVRDDPSKTVVAVGDVIASELEKNYGIAVIHDKTVHNIVFNNSYSRSSKTLDKYLSKYKNKFKVIIDLHRDGGPGAATVTINMNKSNVSRLIFVVGPGNPNKAKNISLVKKLVSIGQSIFPGFIRPGNRGDYGIYYHNKLNKFNQQKSPVAVLMEVGSENSTLGQAKTSGVYIARILAEYINGQK